MSTSRKKSLSGFTLLEMVISLGIFSIIALAVAGTFASGFSTYKETRALSRNLESAQFAMNTLAKLLRTSTIIVPTSPSVSPSITFHDSSSSRCFQYRINPFTSALQARWYGSVDSGNCTAGGFGGISYANVTTGYVTGGFTVVPSVGSPNILSIGSPNIPSIGRITLTLSVKESASSVREARVQTSVSLRDAKEIGF